MKKGFTLIEILAVVTIIGLLFILVIPKITNSLNSKKEDIDNTTNNLIISATKQYINNNIEKFDKEKDNIYCMPLTTLVKENYLDKVMDKDNKDITDIKSVKITYDKSFKYEIVNKSKCNVVYNPPCDYDYCDINGNGYTKVEYLENTGTQWIDTRVLYDTNKKYQMSFNMMITNTYTLAYSGWDYGGIFGVLQNKITNGVNTGTNQHTISNNEYYKIEVIIDSETTIIVNDEYELSRTHPSLSSAAQNSGYPIFIMVSKGEYKYPLKAKLKNLSIMVDNALIRDYVPTIDSSTRPCLFDKVEKKCYYNQGEGEFIYG